MRKTPKKWGNCPPLSQKPVRERFPEIGKSIIFVYLFKSHTRMTIM